MPYRIPACAGKPYRPSNGTEGMMFEDRFCSRCAKSGDGESAPPCDIQWRAWCYSLGEPEYPQEWTHTAEGEPTCTAFEERKEPA